MFEVHFIFKQFNTELSNAFKVFA